MAAKIDFVKEAFGTKMQWYLKVRVMRFWIIPDREKEDKTPFPWRWCCKTKREIVSTPLLGDMLCVCSRKK
ncbi:hypothetical protein P3S68_011173 [Capsicum galapagoense]